jgi:hypothetical protein
MVKKVKINNMETEKKLADLLRIREVQSSNPGQEIGNPEWYFSSFSLFIRKLYSLIILPFVIT